MFGFFNKLPITEQDRLWADEAFQRLERLLGRRRMIEAQVVQPTAEDFPDHYDRTPAAAEKLLTRVCTFMRVKRESIDFEIFPDEMDGLRELLPSWNSQGGRHAAGLYMDDRTITGDEKTKPVVAVRSTQLKDPLTLVATIAHELGHVILLRGELLAPNTPDHKPLTDLLTVFLGLGIFTANSAARFVQFQDDQRQGWSMNRLGYLPEEVYGYALAKFAAIRGEEKPAWAKHLSTNVRAYFQRSQAWLKRKESSLEKLARPGIKIG